MYASSGFVCARQAVRPYLFHIRERDRTEIPDLLDARQCAALIAGPIRMNCLRQKKSLAERVQGSEPVAGMFVGRGNIQQEFETRR